MSQYASSVRRQQLKQTAKCHVYLVRLVKRFFPFVNGLILGAIRSLRLILALLFMSCFSAAQTQPTTTPESGTGIEGVITVSPIHGGPSRIGIPDSKPLTNAPFIVENEKGAVASFVTDDQGHFRISLPPGHYTVSMKNRKGGIGRYGPFDVDVVAGQVTKVEWHCDTGMR